ncbi:hypothetical protein K8R62_00060 [bacterium]|nr:hypothetical protein [bacterium]
MSEITTEQLGELIAQAKSGRVNRENLQAYLRNPNGSMQAGIYPVAIDYAKTIDEMVSAGHYDWKNDDINSKNFSVSGEGVVNVNLELVHLNKTVSSEDVLIYLEKNEMRPATVAELLAFGATHPEVQREFSIICLGSSWVDSDGHRLVPYLLRDGSKRYLNLHWFDYDCLEYCRFLAVRK